MDYFQLEFVQIYHNELTIIVILYLLTTLAILDAKIAFVEWGEERTFNVHFSFWGLSYLGSYVVI